MSQSKLAALVCVDVSPRWMYGHTLQDADEEAYANSFEMRAAMALAHRRLAALMQHVADHTPLKPITVESVQLSRLRLSDLRRAGTIAVCGVYGDWCVLDVALRLKRRGYSIVILDDVCLWSEPLKQIEEPRFKQVRHGRAVKLFPQLIADDPTLWADDSPSF